MINKTLLEYILGSVSMGRDTNHSEVAINALSNYELLQEISEYLEQLYGDPE